ncbi:MAG: hypothetical protein IJP33_00005 [Firmicutes bacterium]|nr:hypothetical protein [Bacillota bacterium]
MKKEQNKKGIVALLSTFMLAAMAGALVINIMVIVDMLSPKLMWLGLALVSLSSVAINVSSVSKRKRKDEDNIATISKPFAVGLVTLACAWALSLILALVL